MTMNRLLSICVASLLTATGWAAPGEESPPLQLELSQRWVYSAPLIAPEDRKTEPSRAQKDPTVVRHQDQWHVFMTVKLPGRSAIEYCAFARWEDADHAPRTLLTVSESDYFCAPQVFYFTPHKLWYLIYQNGVPDADKMWVAYSTTADLTDPSSWTKARPILDGGPEDPRPEGGLDYWVICDQERAFLFLTSLNGKMWRFSTPITSFPKGFSDGALALQDEIFEASHTYKLKDQNRYLTLIEQKGRRYYKAYLADSLDGTWHPLATSEDRPFAGSANIEPAPGVEPWTDNISHGELLRETSDQHLVVDPHNLRFLFQGMWEKHKQDQSYGQFSWRLGLLTPAPAD